MALSSAIEPLRMANRLSKEKLYEWVTISETDLPIQSSSGMSFQTNYTMSCAPKVDMLFICSGDNIKSHVKKNILFFLKTQSQSNTIIGSLCTATYLLAKANLLNGYRATIHWENLASLRDEFPEIIISSELFELDKNRYTCAGGMASLDMMLNIIRQQSGAKLASLISEQFIIDRVRTSNDKQKIPLKQIIGSIQPKLVEAVTLMESNIEEPMSLDELSYHVGLSRRQLERLFQKYLQCVPTRYYMEIRLRRARELLLQTSKSIVDIAFACGFISAPHFSKCYRDYFGIAPRDERKQSQSI